MTNATLSARAATRSTVRRPSRRDKLIIRVVAVVVVLGAIALGTKVVSNSSPLFAGQQKFSAAPFAKKNFPKVQADIAKRAVPAATLAAALKANQDAAAKKYGVPVSGGVGPEVAVSFSGTFGKDDGSGIYTVTVPGLPKTIVVRVQTGPAINGTDLRDATGKFHFGQFTNQIDYQNAASALNDKLKTTVLAKLPSASLTGKKVTGVGVFQLINPEGWLLTPAKLSVS
ncbi:MAG: DUF2291 family protein [Jatrophihabitans sp.]